MGVEFDLYSHNIFSHNSETYSGRRSIKSHLGFLTAVDLMGECLIELIKREII